MASGTWLPDEQDETLVPLRGPAAVLGWGEGGDVMCGFMWWFRSKASPFHGEFHPKHTHPESTSETPFQVEDGEAFSSDASSENPNHPDAFTARLVPQNLGIGSTPDPSRGFGSDPSRGFGSRVASGQMLSNRFLGGWVHTCRVEGMCRVWTKGMCRVW